MQARIGLWGGSYAVRLPKMAVEMLGFKEGKDIQFAIEDDALILRSSKPVYSLGKLVEDAKNLEKPESFDQPPCGDELL